MRVAVVGSREFPGVWRVDRHLYRLRRAWLNDRIIILSGGARGVDQAAEASARKRGMEFELFPAHWRNGDGYDRAAGYKRNLRLVMSADRIVAFWDGESKGTKLTIDIALRERVPLEVVFP